MTSPPRIPTPLRLALAPLVLMALAAAAEPTPTPEAQAPPARSPWATFPSRAVLRQAGPPGGARAVLRCHVDAAGALSACATVSETPSASGLGAALAAKPELFRLKPEAVAAQTQDGAITFSVGSFTFDTPADWLRKPTGKDLMSVWPRAAIRKGIGGSAIISCVIGAQGRLFDCVATSEEPAGMGFGAAALSLTPQFLMKPAMLKGQPVLSVINIPINFKSDGRVYNPAFTPAVVSAAMAWVAAPSYADVAALYPKAAAAAHLAGRATLLCGFDIFGHLDSCRTIAEEPKGQGFGNAAHLLARRFTAPTKTPNGRPIGQAELEMPFTFDPAVLGETKPPVGHAEWIALPTPAQTEAAFGPLAKAREGGGDMRVSLECTVQQGGGLADCAVASETPPGKGVGAAALSLAPQFKVSTWTMEGLPTVGGRIRVPVRLEGAPAPAPKP
jgi:TonB family protein